MDQRAMGVTKTTCLSYCSFLNLIIVLSTYLSIAKSEVITVGGVNRWTDGFNYFPWAQQFNFTVGDVLVFSYTEGKHNVYDVSMPTFQSCNTSNGVNAMYDSGKDHVELKEAKQYWFICTVKSHCSLGMKLGITVSRAASNTTQTGTGNNSSTHTGSGASNKNVSSSSVFYLFLTGAIVSILVIIG